MTDFLSKFQQLLRELFQFDVADLDFGIYQIMNHKRREVERFITEDLPQRVTEALAQGALAEGAQASQELQEVAAQIRQMLGAEALDAAGELAAAYHAIPLGKKYLELKAKAAGARSRDALEALVYNHLFAFFSHYYQDGDFISKRRYSTRQERYAIPYNGEEVTLYWANHDQYYVKTAEYFSDYTFTAANGVTVHFKLRAADVEQNNVKGEKRFFVPQPAETSWDAAAAQLVIPFEFRPLTAQESITYGGKNQQDAILTRALTDIPKRLSAVTAARALAALNEEKRRTADGEPVTALAHHLRQYTRRNTSDFFIHKDLRGFLARELDFYLKNEVLSLDEMEAAGEGRAEGWFELLRAVRAVGSRIIEFLAQVEEFQKMLWEKRKFITETFYCITVGNIPDAFYGEIAACDAEWAEWGVLFDVDAALTQRREDAERMEFLRTHPTLVVDTRHFDQPFVDRLLGSFDDLDEMTDGVLVHSENWQALRLLDERCREQVKCIYIDPPYNTGSDGFPYKDTYQHSTWLAMMQDRVLLLHALLHQNGRFFCSIDDRENDVLLRLLRGIFSAGSYLGTITWEKRTKSQNTVTARRMLQSKVEYIHPFAKRDLRQEFNLESTGQKEYPLVDKKGIYRLQRVEEMSAEGGRGRQTMIFSILGINPRPGKQWQLGEQYINNKLVADEVVLLDGIPHVMVRPEEEEQETFRPFWSHFFDKDAYGTAESGLELLDKALGFGKGFLTVKPLPLLEKLFFHTTDTSDFIMDAFAGSGTSGHAVIDLDRADAGRRKFILIEMSGYFDTTLLPRIKKVTYTPEWQDGKPKRMATAEEAQRGPRIVKVIRLESYEDSLNNIVFDDAAGQQTMQFDDYLLRYMLKWEARKSETLLNVEKLASPFQYKLHIRAGGQTSVKPVDIPETFAYLLGLHVQSRRAYDDRGRRYLVYRGAIDGRQIAVIWRETEGWGQADYEADRQFVAEQKLATGADEVFVNGDSFIPGARALEPLFKARMFAPVEA